MSKELKITREGAKGSFVSIRALIKCHSFHKMYNQCEIKSLILNLIWYGCGSTVSLFDKVKWVV